MAGLLSTDKSSGTHEGRGLRDTRATRPSSRDTKAMCEASSDTDTTRTAETQGGGGGSLMEGDGGSGEVSGQVQLHSGAAEARGMRS